MSVTIAIESPLSDDVRALVQALNEFTYALTPAEYRHHMSVEQMAHADTTLFVARDAEGVPLGMGALRRHDNGVAEVKRMYVKPEARGQRIGEAILAHIEQLARKEGFGRLVLETGTNFDAARRVYERASFSPCDGVLHYPPSPWTAFYSKDLTLGQTRHSGAAEGRTRNPGEKDAPFDPLGSGSRFARPE